MNWNLRIVVVALGLASFPLLAQSPVRMPIHSKVYIEPSSGFENFLTAAFQKKQVPLVLVPDKDQADFLISANAEQTEKASGGKTAGNALSCGLVLVHCGDTGARNEATIVVKTKDGTVAYSYAVKKNGSQFQSAAEACAKHLKEFVETGK